MRFVTGLFIFVGTFFGLYFLISFLAAPIFGPFMDIISNNGWFLLYTVLIGWWTSTLCVKSFDEQIFSE